MRACVHARASFMMLYLLCKIIDPIENLINVLHAPCSNRNEDNNFNIVNWFLN